MQWAAAALGRVRGSLASLFSGSAVEGNAFDAGAAAGAAGGDGRIDGRVHEAEPVPCSRDPAQMAFFERQQFGPGDECNLCLRHAR